ncbi:mannose-1-phosphate guanylyltransferase/mannose-6-phosphate isomerase [Pacificimonas aurantium]|nr:mannose-1-phosphate guanylyltransferase/mannose-6-phosphate isomerase [Pacificimonas aurantium]
MPMIQPVILSGGSGTRLWPLSTSSCPKQFLSLTSASSMIAETVQRAKGEGYAEPIVVTGTNQIDLLRGALASERFTLLAEPAARNTAPAIALAAQHAVETDGAQLLLVMPSDHLIADLAAFREAIDAGKPLAEDGWLVTFGIEPDRPETGYGYIEAGDGISGRGRAAAAFHEKPDPATAERYLQAGGFYWNAGIFLMRADRYLEELSQHEPAIFRAVAAAYRKGALGAEAYVPEASEFRRSPSQSIDYAVMERTERKAVIPVNMGWSDIGSFEALHAVLPRDERGNVVVGDVVAEDCSDGLFWSTGPLVTAAGLQDLVVVATPEAVAVVPRSRSQDVKLIVERLRADGRSQL